MKILAPSRRNSFIYHDEIYTAIANFNDSKKRYRIVYTRIAQITPPDYDFRKFKGYAKAFRYNADIFISGKRFIVPLPFGIAEYYPLFAIYPYKPPRHRR